MISLKNWWLGSQNNSVFYAKEFKIWKYCSLPNVSKKYFFSNFKFFGVQNDIILSKKSFREHSHFLRQKLIFLEHFCAPKIRKLGKMIFVWKFWHSIMAFLRQKLKTWTKNYFFWKFWQNIIEFLRQKFFLRLKYFYKNTGRLLICFVARIVCVAYYAELGGDLIGWETQL